MIPIYLDPARVRVGLMGRDALCVRRLAWLRGLDAAPTVFADAPSDVLRAAAGSALVEHLPGAGELRQFAAIWIADLEPKQARRIAEIAERLNVLVNVEDVKPLCAFHTPAIVRRGRLVLAAGTGGASPAAASAARERLQEAFSEEWTEALEDVAQAREALREAGADMATIAADARERLRRRALITLAQ